MRLTSLELSGFKSFAKKTTLEFKSRITAIVGPNGSGKSNIAEAFQFVLGEQSVKSLRGKKGEDLIWNGGPETPRAGRAKVSVAFDNRERLLNIDFDEVTIERVIYRDAVSDYLLNGSQVRLRDVVELLASAHMGPSGHHIISQGEADRILSANPRERREMVEDALGLKIYQWKRLESERKLEKTTENIRHVESLRREIAPHLKFLKKQVEKVERALSLRQELTSLYRDYLKREELYLAAANESLRREMEEPTHRLASLRRELAAAKAALSKSAAADTKSAEVVSLEGELSALRGKKDGVVREIGRVEGEIASVARLYEREKKRQGGVGAAVPLSALEEFGIEIETDVGKALTDGSVGVLRAALSRLHAAVRDFVRRFKATERGDAEAALAREMAEAEKKAAARKDELEALLKEESELAARYARLRKEVEADKDSSREAEKEVFRIAAEENKLNGELGILRGKEEALRRLEEEWKRELAEGTALIGRDIALYRTFEPVDSAGAPLRGERALMEQRSAQEERRKHIEKIKIRLEDAGAGGGEEIMKEYRDVSEREAFLSRELTDLEKSAEDLRKLIEELKNKLDEEFRGGIGKINDEFQKFFSLMFDGGTARLRLVREERRRRLSEEERELAGEGVEEVEPEDAPEGLAIDVSLPRKKIKGLMMLSGGERALTSIALIFAVSQVNPPPFIILDETDAALDEANSKKYGDMIESLSKHSQLILITHNRETMSRAGVLYGVTMGRDGVSKLLSIAFEEALAVAK